MEKVAIQAEWLEGLAFETEVNGHKLVVDADENAGGSNRGPRPKPLMLVALAGCTGMDVISILDDIALRTNVNPGSEILGVPALVTNAISVPFSSKANIFLPDLSSLCS